ncbi:hypothetical protein [Desulforamulus ruminis]|uniref:hypothetical protein n=1 Tax=Desulforamulus ruminis TaxID=1564 RepID=UPI0003062AAA|nr:hypothetical protein [Desulforamulus ruminis]
MAKQTKKITSFLLNELIVFEKIHAAQIKAKNLKQSKEPYISYDYFGQAIYWVEPARLPSTIR